MFEDSAAARVGEAVRTGRSTCRATVIAILTSFIAATAVSAQNDEMTSPPPPGPPPTGHATPLRGARLGFVVLGAGIGTQIIGSPDAWPRTREGLARRLGDQAGFFAVEESLQSVLRRGTQWQPDPRPCPPAVPLPVRCAASRILTARGPDGRSHVDIPRIAGVLGGTAASLTWRPEGRQPAGQVLGFVATRIGVGLGMPILFRAIHERRSPRKPR